MDSVEMVNKEMIHGPGDGERFHQATQKIGQIEKKGRGYLQRIKSTKETVWIHDTFNTPFNIRNNQNNLTAPRPKWDMVDVPLQNECNFSFWNITQKTMDPRKEPMHCTLREKYKKLVRTLQLQKH